MKRFMLSLLALFVLAAPVFAGVPAKTELALTGSFIQLEDSSDDPWTFETAMLFPLGQGHVIVGPAIAIGNDDDLNRLGLGLEWNLTGQKHGGLFIGATGYYFVKDRDEGDQHTLIGSAGIKFNVGKGAAIKLAVQDVFDGVGKDTTDLAVSAGIIAKF